MAKVRTVSEPPPFDYDYAPDDSEHTFEVFRTEDGKHEAWADSVSEAHALIAELEAGLEV